MNEVKPAELQVVTFRLANEEYGLPITKVQEINRLVSITRLPQAASFMEGIINLRGRIIPVIDLRKRFELPVSKYGEETRIVILEVKGQTIGAVVDAVTEVVRIDACDVEPAPLSVTMATDYIEGIGKIDGRLIIILEVDKIFSKQEEVLLRQMKVDNDDNSTGKGEN
jgi:purine-binding chemotaxis protein CheW